LRYLTTLYFTKLFLPVVFYNDLTILQYSITQIDLVYRKNELKYGLKSISEKFISYMKGEIILPKMSNPFCTRNTSYNSKLEATLVKEKN